MGRNSCETPVVAVASGGFSYGSHSPTYAASASAAGARGSLLAAVETNRCSFAGCLFDARGAATRAERRAAEAYVCNCPHGHVLHRGCVEAWIVSQGQPPAGCARCPVSGRPGALSDFDADRDAAAMAVRRAVDEDRGVEALCVAVLRACSFPAGASPDASAFFPWAPWHVQPTLAIATDALRRLTESRTAWPKALERLCDFIEAVERHQKRLNATAQS